MISVLIACEVGEAVDKWQKNWTMGRKSDWMVSGSTPRSDNQKKTWMDNTWISPRGLSLPTVPLSKAPYSPNICSPGAVHGCPLLCVSSCVHQMNTEEETQPISSQADLTLTPHVKTSITEEEEEKLPEDTVDVESTQNTEEEMQPISNQTDLTLTPHVKTSITEEEEEKLSEDTVDVASTQNTEEEMQPISNQTDLTLTSHVKTSVTEEEVDKLSEDNVDVTSTQNTEEEMQPISEQSDSTIALLQESEMREISQGHGGKEPDQDQTKKEEEAQTCSNQATGGWRSFLTVFSTMASWRTPGTLWQTVRQGFVSLKMVLTRSWRRMGLLLREMLNSRAGS
ncbi:unnamed protein product [Pleuronectes platessa]|uniref:Uncharacterized protein n=1 Tax=Pleuronectes platessa TaxID=8262 RepID=A0A9N7YYN4_PLEPL|nr:unnamed protein product [Pleuronectes platessa]